MNNMNTSKTPLADAAINVIQAIDYESLYLTQDVLSLRSSRITLFDPRSRSYTYKTLKNNYKTKK